MWRRASIISRSLLRATNRLREAEPLYRRALAISEKSLGADNPNTVAVRMNLAALKIMARTAAMKAFFRRLFGKL